MKVYEALNEMEEAGTLQVLLKGGVLSPTITFYREVYLLWDREIKLGAKKLEAYFLLSDKYNVHVNTIKKAVRMMNN